MIHNLFKCKVSYKVNDGNRKKTIIAERIRSLECKFVIVFRKVNDHSTGSKRSAKVYEPAIFIFKLSKSYAEKLRSFYWQF